MLAQLAYVNAYSPLSEEAPVQSIRDDEPGHYVPRVIKYLLYAFTAAPLSAYAAINLLAWRAVRKARPLASTLARRPQVHPP